MDIQTMILVFLVGCGCLITAWGGRAQQITWPLLGAFCAFAFGAWERQQVINRTCQSLILAMDFQARGSQEAKTLDFDMTVNLLERMPRLREATRVCKAASTTD